MPCQSHYWIRGNRAIWAGMLDAEEIAAVRCRDARDAANHIRSINARKDSLLPVMPPATSPGVLYRAAQWFRNFLFG